MKKGDSSPDRYGSHDDSDNKNRKKAEEKLRRDEERMERHRAELRYSKGYGETGKQRYGDYSPSKKKEYSSEQYSHGRLSQDFSRQMSMGQESSRRREEDAYVRLEFRDEKSTRILEARGEGGEGPENFEHMLMLEKFYQKAQDQSSKKKTGDGNDKK